MLPIHLSDSVELSDFVVAAASHAEHSHLQQELNYDQSILITLLITLCSCRFERLDGVMTVAQKVFGSYVSLSCISLVHLNKHYASCF